MTELDFLDETALRKYMKMVGILYNETYSKKQNSKLLHQKLKSLEDIGVVKIKTLGVPGKDGIVWSVKYPNSKKLYALKQYKPTKSSKVIFNESSIQTTLSKYDISPKVIEVNLIAKYIIMDLIEGDTLFEILKNRNGVMTLKEQKDFVEINRKMDSIGIYHGDPSPLNFMYQGDSLKVIDFGFSKIIEDKTTTPNMKSMLLGFIIKMKQIGVDVDKNYTYIKKFIDQADLHNCSIKK